MSQTEAPGKEMSGSKMVWFIIGTIFTASILIIVAISIFYILWDPKPAKEIETIEIKSSFLPIEQSFKLLL